MEPRARTLLLELELARRKREEGEERRRRGRQEMSRWNRVVRRELGRRLRRLRQRKVSCF